MVLDGHTTVGAIVAFNAYVLMLQPPFRMLGMMIMMGQRAAASARRIYEILDTGNDVIDAEDPVDARLCGDLRFDGVRFTYPNGTSALHSLDLHVRPGETVAVVGGTGSGKSTLGRLVARFYDVTGGRVLIDGRDIRDYRLTCLRDQIGIVPDEPFLFSVSIHDNIAYGRPDADRAAVIAAAVAAGADDFVRELPDGYETVVGERGYTLSGGQRQRIAIARALLVNPPILILDDATSAIDVTVEQRIHESLRSLMRGRTTLIVAHRLSTIGLADRVVFVDGGRVVADGTHAELLATEPRYARVLADSGGQPREMAA
jgi:ATP-binding cassette subfamily B protein